MAVDAEATASLKLAAIGAVYQVAGTDMADTAQVLNTTAQLTATAAMATFSADHAGFNPTTATAMPTDTTLQTAYAAWHEKAARWPIRFPKATNLVPRNPGKSRLIPDN